MYSYHPFLKEVEISNCNYYFYLAISCYIISYILVPEPDTIVLL